MYCFLLPSVEQHKKITFAFSIFKRSALPDIIKLLPDNIANQIAAGEVIQRPASAVKELLENAVDAGATEIKLIVTDAGKALIQVIDNGKGMSETDARMAFERHATSKIKSINDLFCIDTMGFRGEALASIAAVAQVELKTKRAEDNNGVLIEVENSAVARQEPVAVVNGTSIAMKNLFFNVPARRNFLKSNPAELRHIIDEFIRVAMSFPHIFFSLTSNEQEVFHLERGSLKQRLIQILGNTYASKIVSVEEKDDYVNIYGFVGKPETAKKSRGDQYFFVNKRFIKSAYLNHAVRQAFDDLIPKDSFAMYALFIDLDPARIDINVHPTKQEIKFEDERIIYAFVSGAVKHALAQFSIMPTLDFNLDARIENTHALRTILSEEEKRSAAGGTALFENFTKKNQAHFIERDTETKSWKSFYEKEDPASALFEVKPQVLHADEENKHFTRGSTTQLHLAYIVVQTDGGYLLVNQQNAHERVLYERFLKAMEGKPIPSQQSLFPVSIDLSPGDKILLEELLPDLELLGFRLNAFGNNSFALQGMPSNVMQGNEKEALERMLEQIKHYSSDLKYSTREKLLRSIALQQSIKMGTSLGGEEREHLLESLFACAQPASTPTGKPTYMSFKKNDLDKMFGR